jgi:hypothetical protein
MRLTRRNTPTSARVGDRANIHRWTNVQLSFTWSATQQQQQQLLDSATVSSKLL